MIKIYYTNKHLEDKFIEENFPKTINKHIKKKHNQNSINTSKRTWELLREIVLKEFLLELKNLDIIFNENGKPITKKFYFSISHSSIVSIVAISDKEVGIDIEEINDTPRIRNLAQRLLKDKNNDNIENFYIAFTSYEASIKYNGNKIGYPKNNLERLDDCFNEIITINNKKYAISYKGEKVVEIMEY